MKRIYISPKVHLHVLAQNLLDTLSGGGKDNGHGDAESKGANYLIDDDDFFGNRSTSCSEAEVYSHFDL